MTTLQKQQSLISFLNNQKPKTQEIMTEHGFSLVTMTEGVQEDEEEAKAKPQPMPLIFEKTSQ